MARQAAPAPAEGAISVLARPRDWADAAALMDTSVRVFAEAIRPVLQGTVASSLAPSNILLLLMMESDTPVRVADIIREGHLIASNATYSLKALHAVGCIDYGSDPGNRRTKIVTLTALGRGIVAAVRERCAPVSGHGWIDASQNVSKNFKIGLLRSGKALADRKARAPLPAKGVRPKAATVPVPIVPAPAEVPAPQVSAPAPSPAKVRQVVARPDDAPVAVQAPAAAAVKGVQERPQVPARPFSMRKMGLPRVATPDLFGHQEPSASEQAMAAAPAAQKGSS